MLPDLFTIGMTTDKKSIYKYTANTSSLTCVMIFEPETARCVFCYSLYIFKIGRIFKLETVFKVPCGIEA